MAEVAKKRVDGIWEGKVIQDGGELVALFVCN